MVCPFHFCGEASAAEPPGIPGMASAETDLCREQHWKQGAEHKERYIWEESRRKVKENPLTGQTQKKKAGLGKKNKIQQSQWNNPVKFC